MYYAWLVVIIAFIFPFRPTSDGAGLIAIDVTTPVANLELPAFYIPQAYQGAAISFAWWQIIFAIWIVGAVASLAFYTFKHYKFTKTVKRWSSPVIDAAVLEIFEATKSSLGIKRRVGLLESSGTSGPILLGIFKPRIFLPNTKLAQDELKFILMHELTHYKRGDLFYKLLVLFATSMHWFNPIIYLVSRAISVHCEISCDAAVVNDLDINARQGYSETIIAVAKRHSMRRTYLVTNFYSGRKSMKKRILEIMTRNNKKTEFGGITLAILLGVASTFAFGSFTVSAIEANIFEPGRQTQRTSHHFAIQSLAMPYARSYEVSFYEIEYTAPYSALTSHFAETIEQDERNANPENTQDDTMLNNLIVPIEEYVTNHDYAGYSLERALNCRNGGRGRGRMNNSSSCESLSARGMHPIFDDNGIVLIWVPQLISQEQVDEIISDLLNLDRADIANAVQSYWLQQ